LVIKLIEVDRARDTVWDLRCERRRHVGYIEYLERWAPELAKEAQQLLAEQIANQP